MYNRDLGLELIQKLIYCQLDINPLSLSHFTLQAKLKIANPHNTENHDPNDTLLNLDIVFSGVIKTCLDIDYYYIDC